nr:glutaminyl-peptide cyclotransferase [Actinokineospora bangkokensis]
MTAATACTSQAGPTSTPSSTRLRAEVVERLPHDPSAFTQGFEVADGVLYEGTGLEGKSQVRALDPATGQVRSSADLPANFFGEGITVVGDDLWQITWKNGVAIKRDRATLREQGRVTYEGEGWGICHDNGRLVMSDGTNTLTFRDPRKFTIRSRVSVLDADGRPVDKLNELECVDGQVWANIWQTDRIVRINPVNGRVTGVVELTGLLTDAERQGADVLNGIAAVPGTDEFLVTGKLWPAMFRVRFTEAP